MEFGKAHSKYLWTSKCKLEIQTPQTDVWAVTYNELSVHPREPGINWLGNTGLEVGLLAQPQQLVRTTCNRERTCLGP